MGYHFEPASKSRCYHRVVYTQTEDDIIILRCLTDRLIQAQAVYQILMSVLGLAHS
jgi:hypothetical protein